MKTQTADLLLAARALGATVLESPAATVIVITTPTTSERMSKTQAAAYVPCSPQTIAEAARAGEFPNASEISERQLSIPKADLDAWLARRPVRLRAVDIDAEDAADLAERLEAAQ